MVDRVAGSAVSRYIDETAPQILAAAALTAAGGGRFYTTREGLLANGRYFVDATSMARHMSGAARDIAAGKSQFLFGIDAHTVVLRAAEYADANGLWVGNRAKVMFSGPVGVVAKTGERTNWVNLYRRASGRVHGCPGNAAR